MGQISRETIEQILAATDIVDLIGSYIPLKRAGTSYKANCPFHHEKTPSFNVSAPKQFYHCFGCGKSGNAIGFVMEHEGLLFLDAVRRLASRAGVVLVEEADDPRAREKRKSRGRLLDLHREAAEFFHGLVKNDPGAQHARDYLKGRGFGREMAERWQIGWMPEDGRVFLDWVKTRGYAGRELVACGLAALRDEARPAAGLYVRFRDRLMFPIHNEVGDVIAFSGRQLREDPRSGKYINSPETEIFKKSNVLFGLDKAKKAILKEKVVILCEGQIDAIACHEGGIENTVAPLGTAFTVQHARMLKRYAKTAVLCFDADKAGLAASERAFRELTPEGLAVKVVVLPEGDDPDTFLKAKGADAFRDLVAGARDFFDFKLELGRTSGRLASAEGRGELARDCTELLAVMGDHVDRDQQIQLVATTLGVSGAALREGIGRAIRKGKVQAGRQAERVARSDEGVRPVAAVRPVAMHRTVGYLCHLALSSGPAQHFLGEQFETLHEAKQWVEGIGLLEKILGLAPDPESSAAVNGFLAGLPTGEQLALHPFLAGEKEADGMQSAQQALGMLSAVVLQKRDAAVKAALKDPGIGAERMRELLEQAKEIGGLLRLTGRSEYDDELAPETVRRVEKPFFRKRNGRE